MMLAVPDSRRRARSDAMAAAHRHRGRARARGRRAAAWFLRRRPPDAPPRDVYPVPAPARPRPTSRAPDSPVAGRAVLVDRVRLVPHACRRSSHALESTDVATCEIEAAARGDLHRRYEIAAIPTTVVADADGVVRRAFVGAFTATDLWAAVAELRDPGQHRPSPTSAQRSRR